MERQISYTVSELEEGMRIGDYLRSRGLSRRVLSCFKELENGILRNGEHVYFTQQLHSGDVLTLHLREEDASEQILPVKFPLSIVYEDEDLMVINKPADMPVHPSVNNHENTLANAVMYYFSSRNIPFTFRCVNRLDRDTSGLLVLAKHKISATLLYQMSADRKLHKEYLAIVEGRIPNSGTIDAPIGRMSGSALMRCVDPEHGDPAVTHYERLKFWPADTQSAQPEFLSGLSSELSSVLSQKLSPELSLKYSPEYSSGFSLKPSSVLSPGLSLVRVQLETGRTHQIRVHMKYIGYPLAGDFLYNPASTAPIQRQALHSSVLDFRHPITGERMHFSCEMPEDMQMLIR